MLGNKPHKIKRLRYFIFKILIGLYSIAFGQEEYPINSSISDVNLFTKGAQINRSAKFLTKKGQMKLKLSGLSPYIKKESIRVNGDGSYTILSVQHQNDFINELDKSKEVEGINTKIKKITSSIEDEETYIKVINSKLDFLNFNKEIVKKSNDISPEFFKSMSSVYGTDLELLHFDLLKRKRKIDEYKNELIKLRTQLRSLNKENDLPSGIIVVTIESDTPQTSQLSFNYLVENASWYPSYDVRFVGVNKSLNITYKANIKQNTGIDWKGINVVLSTAKTDHSAKIPDLNPFFLQYYRPELQRILRGQISGVSVKSEGVLKEESKIQIRGANSYISDGNPLYVIDGVPYIDGEDFDFNAMDKNSIENIEVLKDAATTAIYGTRGSSGVILIKTTKSKTKKSSLPITISKKQETVNEYFINKKQTIKSNNKVSTISYRDSDLEADFEYHSIPKLSENVFLIGKVKDWFKANLTNGEVNIYMENSYVGKSLLDTKVFDNTLEISFGIDNNISIEREKLSEFSESQFIGSSRKEMVAYKIQVRNNKPYKIITKVIDQIPISTTKEISVETIEISGGKKDNDTGKVEWNLTLAPNETKELIIKYAVKSPKKKKLNIE